MHPRDSLATQSDFAKKKPTCSISLRTDIPKCPIIMRLCIYRTCININCNLYSSKIERHEIGMSLKLEKMGLWGYGGQKPPKIIGDHLWMFPKPIMAHNIWTKVGDSCNSDIYEVGFIA